MKYIRVYHALIGAGMSVIFFMMLIDLAVAKSAAVEPEYEASILVENDTGQILDGKDVHKKLIPASMVKMMLALIVLEKLDAGEIQLSDTVTVSAWASKIGGQQVYLAEGEQFPLSEILKAMIISSANDAATAVAEHLAGSADACVTMMNARAKELGMNDTIFENVHGLPPDKGQKENSTTVYDMTILARELLKHPKILTWTSTLEDTFRNGTFVLTNTNRELLMRYPGVDGLKTGFHGRGADFNICITAKREERRLIVVVMGAPRKADRYRAVTNLLNKGFNEFKRVVVFQKGFTVGNPILVARGKIRTTTLVAAEDGAVLVEKGQEQNIRQEVHIPVQEIIAPISRGTRFGEAVIFIGDRQAKTIDLVTEDDIQKGSIMDRMKWWIVNLVS